MRNKSVWLLLLIAALLAADQLTKLLVRRFIMTGDYIELLPFLKLDHIENRGMAFGMLGGYGGLIIFVTSMVVLVLIVAALSVRHDGHMFWPLALLVAGSSGNLTDRFLSSMDVQESVSLWERFAQGSVTDFIHFPYWPAFNFADIYIVAGVLLLARALIFMPGQAEKSETVADS